MKGKNRSNYNHNEVLVLNYEKDINANGSLHPLFNKVITQLLNNDIALSWIHWLLIDTKDKRLGSFLNGDSSRSLNQRYDYRNSHQTLGNVKSNQIKCSVQSFQVSNLQVKQSKMKSRQVVRTGTEQRLRQPTFFPRMT